MGTIQIDGSTPKLTIGNATAEDATILFDGTLEADAITIGGTAVSAGGATKGFAIALAVAL